MLKFEKLFTEYLTQVKRIKNNEVHGLCPFHEDHNSSFSANIETGLWMCHAGCGKGNAQQFADKIGLDPIRFRSRYILDSYRNEKIYISLKKIAEIARINSEFLLNNWGKLDFPASWDPEIAKSILTGWDNNRKTFTYTHIDENNNIIALHYHKNNVLGDGKCKWYPSNRIKSYDKTKPLYITEGEKDANSALPIYNQVATTTTGAMSVPEDSSIIYGFRKYYILYDNDHAGVEGAEKMAHYIKLNNRASSVYKCNWNSSIAGYDLTDSIKNDSTLAELDDVIVNAPEYTLKRQGFQLMKANEILNAPFRKPTFIINQILQDQGICLLAGSDGVGKSLLALQAAFCISTGNVFLDFTVGSPRKVILIQFELDNGNVKERFNSQLAGFRKTYIGGFNDLDNLKFMIIEQDSKMFIDQWGKIEDTIRENDIEGGVLIIDNLYTSTNLDLSDNSQLSKLLSKIHQIKTKYKVSMILVTHHNKGTAKECSLNKDLIRGGKMMTDFATNVFQIGESTLNKDLRIAKITKIRSGDSNIKNIPFKLKFLPESLRFQKGGIIKNESAHFLNMNSRNEITAVLELREAINPRTKFVRKDFLPITKEMGYNSEKTADSFLKKLVSWDLVIRYGHNNYELNIPAIDELEES